MATLKSYQKYNPINYDYVNSLPESWQLLPNIAIFQERNERGYENEELLSVTISRGVIKQTDVDIKKDNSNEDKSKYKLVKVGDIAYNKMRMWQGALGHSDYQGITSPAYIILKPKIKVNPRYFHYMFRSSFYNNYSKRFSYGIVDDQLSLRYTDFKRMYSIVPPLEVQNDIVAYLDNKNDVIDKFIRNKEKLIDLLEKEKEIIINSAITKGIHPDSEMKVSEFEWIREYPAHWEIKKLRFLGMCQNGINIGGDKFGYGTPFVSYGDIYNNIALPEKVSGLVCSSESDQLNYSVREGDIFFTRTSETIEEIGFASTCLQTIPKAVFAGFLIRFRPKSNILYKGFSKYFFRAKIHRAYFVKEVNLVTRASLSQDLLKGLPVLLPPIGEQVLISEYLEKELFKRDCIISKAQKEIASIKEYREALITDLVTGSRSVSPKN